MTAARKIIGLLALLALSASSAAAAEEQYNLILISADDLAAGYTGYEGHPTVQTPNLDRLAAVSANFTHCYSPIAQDAPAQAVLLTGQYPHTNGVTTDGETPDPFAQSFTTSLKRAGYLCGFVGKWDLSPAPGNGPGYGMTDFFAVDDARWQWTGCNVWIQGKPDRVPGFLTDWHFDQAMEFITSSQDQPFFCWISLRAPHEPFAVPPGMEDSYPETAVEVPLDRDIEDLPNVLRQTALVNDYRKNQNNLNKLISQYYALVTRIDQNVGRLLDFLQENQLDGKTIIVFVSENGFMLGQNRLYGTGPLFTDELIRVPLLIRHPQLTAEPSTVDRVVGTVDVAATCCTMLGREIPFGMQGKSLLPLLLDPNDTSIKDERYLEYNKEKGRPFEARGIVTDRFKYVDYLQGDDLLFDLERDPEEKYNVAVIPQYGAVCDVLAKGVELWRLASKDLAADQAMLTKSTGGNSARPAARSQRPTPPRRPNVQRHRPTRPNPNRNRPRPPQRPTPRNRPNTPDPRAPQNNPPSNYQPPAESTNPNR